MNETEADPPPTREKSVDKQQVHFNAFMRKNLPIAMSRLGFHSAIFSDALLMRLCTSLYVTRTCSTSAIASEMKAQRERRRDEEDKDGIQSKRTMRAPSPGLQFKVTVAKGSQPN